MSVIWKFTLDPWEPWLQMPVGARVIHVREQSRQVRMWAEVEPSAMKVVRGFGIGLTGQPTPAGEYLGTAIVNEQGEGGMEVVVHVYDADRELDAVKGEVASVLAPKSEVPVELIAVDVLLDDEVIARADRLVPAHKIEHPRTVRLVAEALVEAAQKSGGDR